MKTCSVCQLPKAFQEFHKDRRRKDGYFPICKSCRADKKKAHPPNRTCLICQAPFYADPSCIKKGHAKYCSEPCRRLGTRKQRPILICATCRMVFPYAYEGGREFCSPQCFIIFLKDQAQSRRNHPPLEKRCSRCKQVKSVKAFSQRRNTPDGHDCICKACTSQQNKTPVKKQARQKWLKTHPEISHQAAWRRKVRIKGAPYEVFTLEEIYLRDGGVCQICHRKTLPPHKGKRNDPKKATLDHIIPVSHPDFMHVGHVRTNVRLAHFGCNSARNNQPGDAQYLLFG
jgi:hypothetical protein